MSDAITFNIYRDASIAGLDHPVTGRTTQFATDITHTTSASMNVTCQNCVITATVQLGDNECDVDFSIAQAGNPFLNCSVQVTSPSDKMRQAKFNCPGCSGVYTVTATIYNCDGDGGGEIVQDVTCSN